MTNELIYLDNAATTQLDSRVLEKMLPYMSENYGNPSSNIYSLGQESKKAIENARQQVAEVIGANPKEIFFTSGGTESDNWAIKGKIFIDPYKSHHIITSEIEHHAVLHTCEYLKKFNTKVTYLPVDNDGIVLVDELKKSINKDTNIVSVMLANNEIGTIQPIREISDIAKKYGVPVHTDAVQAISHMKVDVNELGVDMLSLSGHKFGGPKGAGILYIRSGSGKLDNLFHGGAQESKRRSGTENVAGIVGLGEAITIANAELERNVTIETELRDYFISKVLNKIPDSALNGHPTKRLSFNASIRFKYIEGESILLLLNAENICASSGSACTSGSLDPSHVLMALGIPHEEVHGSLRVTFSPHNTIEQVDKLVDSLIKIVSRLREMSPLC